MLYTWLSQTLSKLVDLSGSAITIIFFVAWVVLWLPIAIPLAIALKWHPPKPITVAQKLPLLASLYILAPLILWGATAIDSSTFASYGLPWRASILHSMGIGLLLGAAGIAAMFAIQYALGWLKWVPNHNEGATESTRPALLTTMASTLLLGLCVGLIEELVFRGFLLNQLQRDYALWLAAAIASLIFAVLHLVWEGSENIPQLPGLWLMGMVLTLARWVDGGDLGLAWGLHSGWIWAIATLDTTKFLVSSGRGPQWFTGAEGKPLAGFIGILFLIATGAILWRIGIP